MAKDIVSTARATVSEMSIGNYKFPCLLMPDGKTFRVAVSQANKILNLATPNNATKGLKALLPEGISLLQIGSDLNSNKVNTISLLDFERLVLAGVKVGNVAATEIAELCIGNTLTARAHDAFGLKYDAEEREAFLEARSQHKKQWRPKFTDWGKLDGCIGVDYAMRTIEIKEAIGLPGRLAVEKMTATQQSLLNEAEVIYSFSRKTGNSHEQSVIAAKINFS